MDVREIIKTAEELSPAPPLHELPAEFASYEDAERPEVKGPWRIETIASADWALARMAELQDEAASIDAQAKEAHDRIEKRAASLKERIARGVGYFRYKLLEYAEAHRDTLLGGGRKKSRSFLHGAVGWRKTGGRLRITDKEALHSWLITQPIESGLYRVSVEPEMRALQDAAKRDGTIPPGCDWEPEIDEPWVKAEAPSTALAKE